MDIKKTAFRNNLKVVEETPLIVYRLIVLFGVLC